VTRLTRYARNALLVIEAWLLLIGVQFVIFWIPFRITARGLTAMARPEEAPLILSQRVRVGVERAARLVPWRPQCLARAIAAKALLARRGYGATLSLGVADPKGKLSAHAWLQTGAIVITGQSEMAKFGEVARF